MRTKINPISQRTPLLSLLSIVNEYYLYSQSISINVLSAHHDDDDKDDKDAKDVCKWQSSC